MAEKGNINFPLNGIQVLTGLEPIRKRPWMYVPKDDPQLASKLLANCLEYAESDGATRAAINLYPGGRATVGYNAPMPTEKRHDRYTIERRLGELHAGGAPTFEPFPEAGGLPVTVGLCSEFEAVIEDGEREWGLKYVRGVLEVPFEMVGSSAFRSTTFDLQLDTEILPNVDFDKAFLREWAAPCLIDIEVL